MNENSFDENNLLYVRKTYEVEVTEKARKIFADNTVQTTLDETNKKLDELIAEMNDKLGFVTQKMIGKNGVEEYIKDVHNQIDNTAVDVTQLVDSGIVKTESHPSITTFKNNRSETKYKTYDFINKTISVGFKDQALRFYNNTDIRDNDKVHAFNIHMEDIEHLKIIEFAFTYSQFPDIVKITNGDIYREPTTKINRVFYGRFFIIRHDPVNAPDEIIVKAIVENADNTGNVVDEYAIDVKKSNIEDKISLKNEIGPTFDIYFRITSRNDLLICIGNINPYKYLLQKSYVESNKQVIDNFNLLKSGIESVKFDKVFYSENQQKVFVVDIEHEKIYIIPDIDKFSIDNISIDNISIDNATVYDKLTTDGFFVKDIGSYTFIGDNSNHCYVYPRGNFTEYTDLGVNVEDVQMMSTNEIIVQVGSELNGRKISRLHMFNYSTLNINNTIFGEFHVSTSDINFIQKNKFIEYEPGKIILVSNSRNGTIYYKFLRYNNSTNTYTNNAIESVTIEQKINIEELEGFDPKNNGTSLDLIRSETGLFIHLNYESEINGKKTVVLSVRDLQIKISNYSFKYVDILKKYNKTSNISYSLTDVIKKIVSTSLLTFGITEENKLLIIDDNYIIDALNFVPVVENGEIKGYSDKDSVLYMKPVEGEEKLYLIDKPYLQDVKAIYQSFKGNIYILDGKGVYELTTTKNLVCKFWTDNSTFTDIVVNKTTEAYIISEKDGKQNIFCHNFDYDDSSSKKLRHKYFDLINGDYEKYDPDNDYTNYSTDETIMIDFKAKLYCTLIDKMSSIYNSKDVHNMYYTNNTYTFNDINPSKQHIIDLVVNGQSITKNATINKFTLSTNKYGFINYFGFTLLNTNNISDINDENLYILIHKSGDNLSIADYREVIYRLIKEQTIKENDKYDSQGNLKPGYETTMSVTKKYKSINKNIVFRHPRCTISSDISDYNNNSELMKFEHGKFKGSLLSDKFSYIYKDTIYNLAQTRTEIGLNTMSPVYEKLIAGKLPVIFMNSYDDDKMDIKYGKRIDPFNVIYNKINYFVGYVKSGDATNLVIVKESSSRSDSSSVMSVVKTISNVISARAINNELYYSKSNGGLFCLNDEFEEVIKVSPQLGYIFYDFTELNDEIYGITNNGVFVKINKDDPKLIPDVIIGDSNNIVFNSNEQILADIYNFENSDNLIIRISHIGDNFTDLYVPYIYVISKSNVNEYTIIQKPFKYKYTNYESMCKSSQDFIFKFVKINNTIFAQGSNNFIFDEKTLSFETFENTLPLQNSIAPISFWSSTEQNFHDTNRLSLTDYLIKTPYNIGCFIPSTGNVAMIIDNVSKEFIRRELTPVDSENPPITDVMNINPNGTIIGRISNNVSSGKKYRIEVLKNGKVCVNGNVVNKIDNNGSEQTLDNLYTVSDINAVVYKNAIHIEKNFITGTYIIKDINGNPINLFKLDHKRCSWNSLKFTETITASQLLDKHIIPYRYVIDDMSKFEIVDTDIIKYPIPGIKYYTKTTLGNFDNYEATSEDITKWEVNSSGKVEYFEPKHHYEVITNVTDPIVAGSYVFICENRYFTKAEIITNEDGESILPNTEEYYILSTKSISVDLSKVIDERAVFILNDDKVLLHAKVDGIYKTIIYDTYLENDFTRHDVWDRVYPKTGFDIKRIWETSRGKFAVINIPCYDHYFVCLISDDLQTIYCKLNYDIIDPGCVHLIDTEKELLISIANSDYTSVVNYIYDTSNNIFKVSNTPLICIDSVEVEGKTYIAAIKHIRDSITDKNLISFSIYDIDKNLLLSIDKGITIPVYNTTRNNIKQFDNVFVKRLNSITGKEEAYVFFSQNTSINDTSDDSVYDCVHISRNVVQLEDLNFLAYTKFGNVDGKITFVNTMLTPENKILLICSYSAIFSLEENGSINVITGSPSFIKPINDNGNDLVDLGDIVFKNTHSEIPSISSIEDNENILPSTYNWHYYNQVNNTYLIDSSESYRDDMSGYFRDHPLLIDYKFYLANIFQKCYVSEGNMLDPFDIIFKYIIGDNKIKPYSESSLFITDPKSLIRHKCLPVSYKDTMVFGTSVLDEQTGEPSSNWFSIYESDKTTLISDFICFDYLFVAKSGKMFSVYGSNIYENDDVLSSSKWFKVQGGSAHEYEYTDNGLIYNTFKKMVETAYGIFYFDSKNILKYNEESDKFEVVPHEFDLTTNSLNFAEKFNTGLFIGNKRDSVFEKRRSDAGFNESDFSTTGINFNYYDPKQNEFISLLPDTILTSISKMSISRIVDIQETSKGVFILYCANDNTYKNTIFRCYLSVYNVLLWEECKYKTTFKLLDGSSYTNEYPCNHSQVWEDETTNTIWISGTTYVTTENNAGMTMSDYQNTNITIGRYSGAWAYRKFVENDNGDYRHNHGIDFRFEPNIPNSSLDDATDSVVYARKRGNPLFDKFNGLEKIVSTKFGNFVISNDVSPISNDSRTFIYKINGVGFNGEVNDITYFEYKQLSSYGLPSGIKDAYYCKEINDKLFVIFNGDSTNSIYIYEYDIEKNKFIPYFAYGEKTTSQSQFNEKIITNDVELTEYNGIVYMKSSIDSNIFMFGDKQFDGIINSPESESNNVLYELRAIFDNQDSYNNLVEKTDNSNLDKFVFKEIGIIDGITGLTKHIFQYFEPNEFYNESDGVVKPLITKPREFHQSNSIKQLYKNIYQKFNSKNLINNRFLKQGQTIIADGFKHEVSKILGDVENYLVNTDNVRIELKIYPTETEDFIDSNIKPCKFGITTSVADDESGIEPFDPYD